MGLIAQISCERGPLLLLTSYVPVTRSSPLTLVSVLFLLFFAMLALPGYCINFPIVAIAKLVAIRGARTALAGSTVKVAGRDVMASYKVLGCVRRVPAPAPGMHKKGRDLRGSPRSRWISGWRRLPKRLGAVTVGYKCH